MRMSLSSSALLAGALAFAAFNAWADDPPASTPTDPQIAQIVVTANQQDINAAKLAKTHAASKNVLSFANTMIRDHQASNTQAKELVSRLKVTPEPSATSKSLESAGKENLDALKKLKGAEFDKQYVEHEVAYHQQVLDTIKDTLIPNAQNPELKSLLEKTQPVIQAHLDHAKKLQGELGAGVGGSGH